MATYKIIQDIETEDKLLGPLTLRQFIYAGITVLSGYLAFLAASHKIWFLLILFVPVMVAAGFFAFPWKVNQSTETWALAKVRFLFKPRRRVWDQSGTKKLVTITAPKKVDKAARRNLSPTEVQSRLKSLADTIDSRGWASKNVNVNMYSPVTDNPSDEDSERLVNITTLPQSVSGDVDIHASDDILDEQNSSTAKNLTKMLNDSTQDRKQQLTEQLNESSTSDTPSVAADDKIRESSSEDWFTSNPRRQVAPGHVTFDSQVLAPFAPNNMDTDDSEPTKSELEILKKLKSQQKKSESAYSHLKVIQPLSVQKLMRRAEASFKQPVKRKQSPAIISLSRNNDRSVDSLSREVNKNLGNEEVVINLH